MELTLVDAEIVFFSFSSISLELEKTEIEKNWNCSGPKWKLWNWYEIDEFEEKFEINLNESSVETLGGYMTKKLGILPKVGDKIIVESIELVVTAADKRRIKKIGISIIS